MQQVDDQIRECGGNQYIKKKTHTHPIIIVLLEGA